MIDITKLTEADRGRSVVYSPPGGHGTPERGVLSSWNDRYVFARYSAGDTAAAADPRDLVWFSDYQGDYVDRTSGRTVEAIAMGDLRADVAGPGHRREHVVLRDVHISFGQPGELWLASPADRHEEGSD